MKNIDMKKQFVELLEIHAVSSKEKPVRDYLINELSSKVDTLKVDSYGNLLGEKKIGNGEGATILLSAHMDTVRAVVKDREVLYKDGIFTSSKGALGADDRAGIAIILDVMRKVEDTRFNGNIKLSFSREEEIGCVGANKIDVNWYKDVDLAIIVDRRGGRDIVTGCLTPFCSNEVGLFIEDVSSKLNMNWKCVEGGISDATVFSEKGVNSVNLSAGYSNEHTDKEYAVYEHMVDCVNLVLGIFVNVNDYVSGFTQVPKSNKWVHSSKWNDGFYNDYNGEYDIRLTEFGGFHYIEQGINEISMSPREMKDLYEELGKAIQRMES